MRGGGGEGNRAGRDCCGKGVEDRSVPVHNLRYNSWRAALSGRSQPLSQAPLWLRGKSAVLIMQQVNCPSCGKSSSHPKPVLQRMTQNPPATYEGGVYINYACPGCHNLSRAEVPKALLPLDTKDRSRHPEDLIDFVITLECEKTGCETPLAVFAPVKRDTIPDGFATHVAAQWKQHSAACANGHPPRQPFKMTKLPQEIRWNTSVW